MEPVLDRIADLVAEDKTDEAYQELLTAIATLGEEPKLLEELADVEIIRDHYQAAISHLARAVALSPDDPSVLAAYASTLSILGLQRKAITFIDGLSKDLRNEPRLREVLASIYAKGHWHALAVEVFGEPRALSEEAKLVRRRSWWLSGGPAKLVRKRVLGIDIEARSTWNSYSESLTALSDLDKPDGFAAERLRARMDAYLERWATLAVRWRIVYRLTKLLIFPIILVAGFAGALLVFHVADRHSRLSSFYGSAIACLLVAAFGYFLIIAIVSRFDSHFVAAAVLSAVYVACGALLLDGSPVHSNRAIVGIGIIEATYLWWTAQISINVTDFTLLARSHNFQRQHPYEAIIDCLLDVLKGVANPDLRYDLQAHLHWIRLVEDAAKLMERYLAASLRTGHLETDTWISTRIQGAAAGLRRMNRQIAIPSGTTWERLRSSLRAEVSALASGDLAGLRWAPPPTPETRLNRVRRSLNSVTRTAVVMFVPIAALLLLQPLLKLDSATFGITKAATAGWAILYLLIAVDPTLNDKIATARSLLTLLRTDREQRLGFPDKPPRGQSTAAGDL